MTIAAVRTAGANGAMRPETFLARVAGDLGEGVMTHHDGDLAGKARLGTDTSSGIEVGVLEGFSAVTGKGAAIRIRRSTMRTTGSGPSTCGRRCGRSDREPDEDRVTRKLSQGRARVATVPPGGRGGAQA